MPKVGQGWLLVGPCMIILIPFSPSGWYLLGKGSKTFPQAIAFATDSIYLGANCATKYSWILVTWDFPNGIISIFTCQSRISHWLTILQPADGDYDDGDASGSNFWVGAHFLQKVSLLRMLAPGPEPFLRHMLLAVMMIVAGLEIW